jgi:hypothetical protein
MVKRSDWILPLGAAKAELIIVLVITFLFLPLWLHALLDILLVASLVWVSQDWTAWRTQA